MISMFLDLLNTRENMLSEAKDSIAQFKNKRYIINIQCHQSTKFNFVARK